MSLCLSLSFSSLSPSPTAPLLTYLLWGIIQPDGLRLGPPNNVSRWRRTSDMSDDHRHALTPHGTWLACFSMLSTHISLKTGGHQSFRTAPWQALCIWHRTCVCSLRKICSRFLSRRTEPWIRGLLCASAAAPSRNQRSRTWYWRTGFLGFFFPSRLWFAYFQTVIDSSKWQLLNDKFYLDCQNETSRLEAITLFHNSKRKSALQLQRPTCSYKYLFIPTKAKSFIWHSFVRQYKHFLAFHRW